MPSRTPFAAAHVGAHQGDVAEAQVPLDLVERLLPHAAHLGIGDPHEPDKEMDDVMGRLLPKLIDRDTSTPGVWPAGRRL